MIIDKRKVRIAVLIILVFTIILIVINKNKSVEKPVKNIQEIVVQNIEDGTKLNTSNKLKETKKVGNIEISNIQITRKNEKTTLLADAKNIGNNKIDMLELEIILLDKNDKEIGKLTGLLGTIPIGETAQLNVSSTKDFSSVHDVMIKLK